MANVLIPKKSTVAAKVPGVSDLALGEIAINHADAKLYARHPVSGTIQQIGGGDVTIDTTLADLLTATSGTLSADDLGSDKIYFWDDSASRATGLDLGTGLAITGTTLNNTASGGSKTLATFTPRDHQPPASAFATLDTRNSIAVLDYDAATDENAVFVGIMPEAASLGSGLIVRLHWMPTSDVTTSRNVRWRVAFERSNTDLDLLDGFAANTEANGAVPSATSGIPQMTSITVASGDLDGITAGDLFRLRVTRVGSDSTNDTMTGDAELIAVEVRSAA